MDRILIQMPSDLHEFMIAMAIVQEFQMQMVVGIQRNHRDPHFTTTFRMDDKFKMFEPCLKVINDHTPEHDYSGWNEYVRGDYDYFIDFDFIKAQELMKYNPRHITEAFGVLIGTFTGAIQYGVWPQKQPILGPLTLKKQNSDFSVLLMNWDIEVSNKFSGYLRNNYPELTITIIEKESIDPEIVTQCVANYDVIIGKASPTTYIAASLNKMVIEIFNSDNDYNLYNNTNIEFYEVAVGNPSAAFLWKLWEDVWLGYQEHLSDIQFQGLKTQTDLLQSTADNVDEKLVATPNP